MNLSHALAVLRAHPRPARLAAARVLAWSGLSRFLTIPMEGYRLRFYPTNTSANLWINAGGRVHGLDLFRDYCRPGETAVDVGANIGEVSLLLSRGVGPSGRVYAFEPHPRIYGYLRGNLALNGRANVDARNLAIGAAAGAVRMSDGKLDDMNRVEEAGTLPVRCSTLDLEIPATGAIALLKVDVEGNELRVLEGGPGTIARAACINCEMGEAHYRRYGYGMSDLIAYLRARGFETFVAAPARVLRPVDATFAEGGGHELIAVRDVDDFVTRTGWRLR